MRTEIEACMAQALQYFQLAEEDFKDARYFECSCNSFISIQYAMKASILKDGGSMTIAFGNCEIPREMFGKSAAESYVESARSMIEFTKSEIGE